MRFRAFLAFIVLCLVIGMWLRFAEREKGEEVGMQADLVGRWVTDSETHSDRYINITDENIAFGQGGGVEARHPIVGVWTLASETGSTYRIRYFTDELAEAELVVTINGSPPVLRLKNQGGIAWTLER